MLLSADRPEDALRELAALPASDAISAEAHTLRAYALVNLDRWPDAALAAREGLAAGGPDPTCCACWAAPGRRWAGCERPSGRCWTAWRWRPNDADLLCAYARLCLADQQVDKVAKLVERAAAQEPHSPSAYATRVQIAYARGDDRAAQRIAREFVAEYLENPAAHALLGSTSAARGQVRDAYSGLRQAAANAPDEQVFAESALEAKIASHPLLAPVRPVMRLGPLTWIAAIVIIYGLRAVGLTVLAAVVGLLWLVFCVYSWAVLPLVSRWVKRRWR